MSLKQLVGLSTYKGTDFTTRLNDLKTVLKHCEVLKPYSISPEAKQYFESSGRIRYYLSRTIQRLNGTKNTIKSFLSLVSEVGPKSEYVAQVRTKIMSSGMLKESSSPYDVLSGRHALTMTPVPR
ncbi:hypothetical protein AAMO2058_001613600 [Amorphochlora amoebiformis]